MYGPKDETNAGEIPSVGAATAGEFLRDFSRAIEYGDGESFRFHVEGKVFAHDSQANDSNITLIRAHFNIFFSSSSKQSQLTVASN